MAVFDRAIAKSLPLVPRGIVRRLSAPYIAGPTIEDAMRVVAQLNAHGKQATIDVLGETVTNTDEARAIACEYHRVLARLDELSLDAGVSVKLTGLGLAIDDTLCRENVEAILEDAAARGRFVRIDMEDSSTTELTLELFREFAAVGHQNVGIVVQAYLHRTESDLPGLANVRICKGIYVEPAAIAFHDPDEIRASYLRCLDKLFDAGSYVAIATHDEQLIVEAERRVRERGLTPDQYEFQMLLGVRSERGDALVRAGHRVRVYVPFGTHWYEYSVRRLQENPKIARYIALDLARRFTRRPPV